jgi:8-oxo-dGTP pyrophosphatase MutT (NUDIX family)
MMDKIAAGNFFTDGRSVLMLKRSKDDTGAGQWGLPGGKGKKDDDTESVVADRETREETGLEDMPGESFDSLATPGEGRTYTAFIRKVDKPFHVKLSGEHSDWKWVPFGDLNGMDLHPKFREHLPSYLKKVRRQIKGFAEWATITEAIILIRR